MLDYLVLVLFPVEVQQELPQHLRIMALLSQEGFEFVPYREV